MYQYFICVACGAENEVDIELGAGDSQEFNTACAECGRKNLIAARYNYAFNEFELEISPAEDDG